MGLRWAVFAVCALAGIACGDASGPDSGRPPNIVLIIGDDHGWPYFGFMGDPIVETPHLDALAAEGVSFPSAFNTASTCKPSLMTLLTGLHPVQWAARQKSLRAQGVRRRRDRQILDVETLPRLLGAHGYRTFQGGKYWEGAYENAGFESGTKNTPKSTPEGVPRPAVPFHQTLMRNAGGVGLTLGRTTMQPLWDFVLTDDERPFFVWFAPKLPHTPHNAPEAYLRRYSNKGLSLAAQRYYANITRFDERVGELVAFLDENGLQDDTLLVYLSDNGWQQDPRDGIHIKSLGGPQGKGSMHELGFRTPLLLRWLGGLPAGAVREDLVSTVDLFATLLGFAGVDTPGDRSGRDLRDRVLGLGEPLLDPVFGSSSRQVRVPPRTHREDPAHPAIRNEQAYFVRTERWRYIWYSDAARFPDREEDALYRIDVDPRETHNVAAEHPETIAEFRQQILAWIDLQTAPYRMPPAAPAD